MRTIPVPTSPARPRRPAARTLTLALSALLAAGLLTACGGDEPQSQPQSAGAAGFPVSIAHKYGTTEIPKTPTRVVTLGLSDQEPVLALGVKPVGAVDWFKERPYGKFPWTEKLWAGTQPEIVGERDDYNFEKIAALKPDLVIAQYSGMKKEQYDTLSKIAPVVAQPPKFADYQAPWQEMTTTIGRALGKQKEADALVAGIDKRFADARKAHPEWAGKSVVVADAYQPGSYSAFSPSDPKMLFMSALGYRMSDKLKAFVGSRNVVDFGVERSDLLEADRLVWLTSDPGAEPRIKADPLYRKLKVVQDKRDLFVSYAAPPIGAAVSFNTVLSIPYAIDGIVPLLAAAPK